MHRSLRLISLFAAVTVAGTGCKFQNKTLLPTSPSTSGASGSSGATSNDTGGSSAGISVAGLAGTWGSTTIPGLPNIGNCTDVQWQIGSQSATTITGTISALCGGIANVNATLSGHMTSEDVVDLTATGTIVALGITCPFSLSGTGHRETSDSVRLDYQGNTCAGPLSGSELLHRNSPAPAPAPAPEPSRHPRSRKAGVVRLIRAPATA